MKYWFKNYQTNKVQYWLLVKKIYVNLFLTNLMAYKLHNMQGREINLTEHSKPAMVIILEIWIISEPHFWNIDSMVSENVNKGENFPDFPAIYYINLFMRVSHIHPVHIHIHPVKHWFYIISESFVGLTSSYYINISEYTSTLPQNACGLLPNGL